MKPRTAARLAWSMGVLALAMICGAVVLALLTTTDLESLSAAIIVVVPVLVGGLVASRRPENPIGWLFLGGSLFSALRALTAGYAVYGFETDPGTLPLVQPVTGFSNAVELVGPVLLFVLVPLYFPTGRPVSRRWGIIAWLALGVLPAMIFLQAVSPGEAVYGTGIPNPWTVEALRPFVEVVGPIGFAYYIGLIFASAASLILRFWRSRGEERQQIKWFTFAAAFIPVWFITNSPIERAFPALFSVMDPLIIAAVPVAAGIAILRYRLYDIDVIINRTLVYGTLTVVLVGIYLGTVIALQYALRVISGQETQLAVVASTLAIAALFNPLRRSVQAFIDRLFYRQKYDARETLEAFSVRLRDETDLGVLGEDLVTVVRDTVQPAHVSLWLRTPDAGTRNGRSRTEQGQEGDIAPVAMRDGTRTEGGRP